MVVVVVGAWRHTRPCGGLVCGGAEISRGAGLGAGAAGVHIDGMDCREAVFRQDSADQCGT